MRLRTTLFALALAHTSFASNASAQSEAATPAAPASPTTPSPYSLPFQLRPVVAATVLRSDTSYAAYENAASVGGTTVVTTLLASVRVPGSGSKPGTGFMPVLRLALAGDSPPSGKGGVAVVNGLLGASYAFVIGNGFRASTFFAFTIPVGMGGGDTPSPGPADARAKGLVARASMDNALFAVNDFTVVPGLDLAWVGSGLTLQAEATLLQLTRIRGGVAQHERAKTNATFGVHAGYFFAPAFSLGGEIRYQRWLNAPIAVDKDATGTLVDNLTFAIGPRLHIPLGGGVVAHPGVAYARGLDKPMAAATPNYHIVQLDIPIVL